MQCRQARRCSFPMPVENWKVHFLRLVAKVFPLALSACSRGEGKASARLGHCPPKRPCTMPNPPHFLLPCSGRFPEVQRAVVLHARRENPALPQWARTSPPNQEKSPADTCGAFVFSSREAGEITRRPTSVRRPGCRPAMRRSPRSHTVPLLLSLLQSRVP